MTDSYVHKKVCTFAKKTKEYIQRRFEFLCGGYKSGQEMSYWWKDVTCPDCLKEMPRTTKLYRNLR